jgi:hypothetical protein
MAGWSRARHVAEVYRRSLETAIGSKMTLPVRGQFLSLFLSAISAGRRRRIAQTQAVFL